MNTAGFSNNDISAEDREKQTLLQEQGPIPRHIAVIMDGNGRWAKSRGSMRIFGHKAGVESVRDTTEACAQVGVKHLTLYAFSTENWDRPKSEVSALMKLLVQSLRNETRKLDDNDIRLTTIGETDRLPPSCRRELEDAMALTENNSRMELCLALSYSGRWDIRQAMAAISEKVRDGLLDAADVSDEMISDHLATARMPDPELIIRTSGELRLSNFLLWQSAYSELYVTDTFWPDFRRNELYKAIASFQKRERRFGKVLHGAEVQESTAAFR
ncbi:isoprenyl transferase [Balneolales bacterium ANBcel1]|nr:isoprenyl transferase [Balneolales bacterium ANBcel1]